MWNRLVPRAAAAVLTAVAIAVAGVPVAWALTVSPVHLEMGPIGKSGRSQITVSNDSASQMPVEINIQKLAVGEDGRQTFSKAGDEFLIFPPQALLKPGASQNFRIQWVGEPNLARSESYMLSVNQIPVQMPKGSAGVQIVMSFGVMVNVAPARTTLPQLKLVATSVATDKATGKARPVVTVENPGSVHALMQQASLKLTAEGWSKTLTRSEISQKIGIGLVQPGARRRFVLPLDPPPGIRDLKATLEYLPAR